METFSGNFFFFKSTVALKTSSLGEGGFKSVDLPFLP